MGTYHYYSTVPATDTALVTASADVILPNFYAWNVTGTPAALNLSVVRASGQVESLVTAFPVAAGTGQQVIQARLLADEGILLRAGDALHGSASVASAVTVLAFE